MSDDLAPKCYELDNTMSELAGATQNTACGVDGGGRAHSSNRIQSMRTAKSTARRASSRCITSAYSTARTAGMPLRVIKASCK